MKLIINNLTKKINKTIYLDIGHFEFESNKINIINGLNGSGKTTLLLVLSLIDKDFKGSIKLFEEDKEIKYSHSNSIYVSSKNSLIEYLSLKENLNLISKVNLEEFSNFLDININSNVSNLSGGEEELVSLFRLKNTRNRVILLDEVTSYLDDSNLLKVFSLLEDIASLNNLIIFATHDVRVLSHYNENTIYLKNKGLINNA